MPTVSLQTISLFEEVSLESDFFLLSNHTRWGSFIQVFDNEGNGNQEQSEIENEEEDLTLLLAHPSREADSVLYTTLHYS